MGGLLGGSAVRRYTPDGSLQRTVSLPTTNITSCAFGGPDLAVYITSAREGLTPEQLESESHAGALFVCSPGVAGRPQRPFGGEPACPSQANVPGLLDGRSRGAMSPRAEE